MALLDRTSSYLELFSEKVQIDKTLPKWKKIEQYLKESDKQDSLDDQVTAQIYNTYVPILTNSTTSTSYAPVPVSITNSKQKPQSVGEFSLEDLVKLSVEQFNVIVSKKIVDSNVPYLTTPLTITSSNDLVDGSKSSASIFKRFLLFFQKLFKSTKNQGNTEEYSIDVISFFASVKAISKSQQDQYVNRIKPYLIALEQAQSIGQQALVDRLVSEIFKNKYESFLYSAGLHTKISEQQIVDFINKTERGVRLDYIKNFARPVPQEVIKKKLEVDDLLVFDNYVILHYDPEDKSHSKTREEQEKIRQRRRDPILFGVIYGIRELFYITDWTDDYCDLTLEEFVRVSGLDKQDIEISKKIKL